MRKIIKNLEKEEIERPEEPSKGVEKVYCIYYDDGEMTISQDKIEPEAGRTVVNNGFYDRPLSCTYEMTTVRFVGPVKPKSCEKWFGIWSSNVSCINLKEIKNIENLYTNECTNMSMMFSNCESLTSLDVSNFDTSNVTTISDMFSGCSSLTSLDVSNFDTTKVTTISDMFSGCTSLTSLDVSNFDTSNVTDMDYMFYNCTSLTSLDVSNFDTSNVTTMAVMFADCTSLTSLDVSNFNTSNVTNMDYMFDNCTSLTEKGVKVSKETYNKMLELSNKNKKSFEEYINKSEAYFDIIN